MIFLFFYLIGFKISPRTGFPGIGPVFVSGSCRFLEELSLYSDLIFKLEESIPKSFLS